MVKLHTQTYIHTHIYGARKKKKRQTERQKNRQTERQKNKQTYKQADKGHSEVV